MISPVLQYRTHDRSDQKPSQTLGRGGRGSTPQSRGTTQLTCKDQSRILPPTWSEQHPLFGTRREICFCYCLFFANIFSYGSTPFAEIIVAIVFLANLFFFERGLCRISSAQQGRSGRPASRRSSRSITSLQQRRLKNAEDL